MKAPNARTSFLLLCGLTLVSLALPIWEYANGHQVSLVSAMTAGMFLAMVVMWPFLTGTRLSQGHLQKASMCVECKTLRWPAEQALGFCLRCGSVRPAVPAGY